jgi:small subunit ribosomal protein S6
MEERLYDLVFILMPATPEEEIAKIISTMETAITEHGGKVEKVEKMGTRKMAYRVAKQREGFYVYISFRSGKGDLIKELERRLKVSDPVIKYMTVRLDEELQRQQKLVGRREKRARRRPPKTVGTGTASSPSPTPSPTPSPVPAAPPAEAPAAAPAAAPAPAPAGGSHT